MSTEDPSLWFALGAVVAGVLTLVTAAWLARILIRRRLVDDLPRLPAAGVFIGLVEVHGTAESEQPFHGYLSGRPCVLHTWSVEEHWIRTRTVTETDSKGNTRTRTETYTGSDTVASGGEERPFWLRDDSGVVRVDPEEATTNLVSTFHETVGRGDPLYDGKGPQRSVSGSTGRRTFSERAIPLHHEVYVIGKARLRDDAVAPEIAGGGDVGLFRIACGGEAQVRRSLGWKAFGAGFLTFVLGAAVPLCALGASEAGDLHDATPLVVGAVLGGLGAVLAAWTWSVRDGLIDTRERVRQARALIDVELQRRSDLVPRLVEIVAASAGHERTVQATLALLRAQAGATVEGRPGADPMAVAAPLRAVAEAHPDLGTSESFADLLRRLVDVEDRIARARAYANAIAANYATRLEQVPDVMMARLLALRPFPPFEAQGFERRSVAVEFDRGRSGRARRAGAGGASRRRRPRDENGGP